VYLKTLLHATSPPVLSFITAQALSGFWAYLFAKQLDAPEERLVRHAADVHLQDLPRVPELLVQVEDAGGDFLRSTRIGRFSTSADARPTCGFST
jgi:hypothetical protein